MESEPDQDWFKGVAIGIVAGLAFGLIIGASVFSSPQPTPSADMIQDAREAGYEKGVSELPGGNVLVAFKKQSLFKRSIAFVYPDRNLSYHCTVSREFQPETGGGEWVISRSAFMYNGSVDCGTVDENVISEWDSSTVDDVPLRNRANTTR